ncbi:MAG: S9 family peptidase [Cytophagaceae bacterium]|nr:S9 family peptidase [Cytophagaceae bacterium]
MKNVFRLTLLLVWLGPVAGAQTQTPVAVTDLTKIRTVTFVNFAPDGQRAVYAVQSLEPNETDKLDFDYRTHLWLTDFVNPPRQLTRGSESVSRSVWVDNKSLLFARNVKTKSQLFLLSFEGGEPVQLTDWKYGASNPQVAPDGSKVVFSVSLTQSELLSDSLFNAPKSLPAWSLEKPGFTDNSFLKPGKDVKPNPDGSLAEIRAYLAKDEEDKKAKVINRLNFQGEATTQPELNFSHLAILEVREGAKPRPLTTGFQSYNGATWAADGQQIYTVTGLDSLNHPDREVDSRLWAISVDGAGRRSLVANQGQRVSLPVPSPDGRWLALQTTTSTGVNFPHLALANADGSNLQAIDFDRAVSNQVWSKDSKALYFTAPTNGGFPLYRLDVQTRALERLTDFDTGVGDFDVSQNRLVFAKTEVANPSELYAATLPAAGKSRKAVPIIFTPEVLKKAVRLSNLNGEWLKARTLSFPEKRTFTNSKNQTIEYWIMKPAGWEAGKKYPLMLNMHGGPTAMWGPGEATMWHEFQYFCGKGYGLVYANPRGSGGYGLDFQRANIKDWGTGPTEDVLTAATAAARETWVDTSRQVLTGGSYAGYLTAWIVAHDNRFKAAFAQRGVYDLTTFLGEGNAWRLIPSYFQYPWLDQQEHVLASNSPYSFVQNIRTPLLIKHGENDLRTGPIQSEMMYKSLKILGRPVEYVRMPGATHELSRSGNVRQRLDRMLRMYEFFERYVGDSKTGQKPEGGK